MYILAIDTGKHLGAALLKNDDLRDIFYQHETCFEKSDVDELGKRLLKEVLIPSHANPSETEVVIEVPSHRFFGRANSSAVLKAMWQGVRLMIFFRGLVKRVTLIPADRWNRQRGDAEKKRYFQRVFPQWKKLAYYENKHGGRSNSHERDACLLALWLYDHRKLETRAA